MSILVLKKKKKTEGLNLWNFPMTCGTTDPNTMWNFNTNYKVEDIGHLVSVGEEIQDGKINLLVV